MSHQGFQKGLKAIQFQCSWVKKDIMIQGNPAGLDEQVYSSVRGHVLVWMKQGAVHPNVTSSQF